MLEHREAIHCLLINLTNETDVLLKRVVAPALTHIKWRRTVRAPKAF